MALKALDELREEFGNIPPPNATRLQIEEIYDEEEETKGPTDTSADTIIKTDKAPPTDRSSVTRKEPSAENTVTTKKACIPPKKVDYDLSELVKPDCVVKSKFSEMAESLSKGFQPTEKPRKKAQPVPNKEKILIEEIQ